MNIKLIYLESSDTDFNGKHYHIDRFLDLNSLQILNAVNIDTKKDLVPYQAYNCKIEFTKNKLRVVDLQ